MTWRPSFSLVVPLFNEEERFAERGPDLADFIARYPIGSELIFVDDGSTDTTVRLVGAFIVSRPELPVRLIQQSHAGKGAAVREGLAQATADYAGFCDVDLSTPLDQLEHVIKAALMSRVLAIGSRDAAASRLIRPQGHVRELLGRTYNRFVQLTLTPGILDTQCGAKVASTAVWKAILPWCQEVGFAWDVEALAVARRAGIVVREVAVEWSHDDRSRVRVGRDGIKMVLAVPRIARQVTEVPLVAPAASPSGVFDERQAATLTGSDTGHWWFRSKGSFVAWAVRRHLPPTQRDGRLIDLGAGAGGVTAILGWKPDRLFSLDGSAGLCRVARDRHALLAAAAMTEALPLRNGAAGVVTLLDVIEHLEHPTIVLEEARRVLEDDGLLVVNVPAHQWLWSRGDELLGHVRRYDQPALRSQLEAAGFRVEWMSHIFSWLVVPVWLQRRLETDAGRQLGLDRTSALVDRAAMVLTRLERLLVRWVPLPLGTSILCVATKAPVTSDRRGRGLLGR